MVEPLFIPRLYAGDLSIEPQVKPFDAIGREKYLLWRATSIAIESALRFGIDYPVGAVVASDDVVSGVFFASDGRTNFPQLHAEERAIAYSKFHGYVQPDTLAVTLEPCRACQEIIIDTPSIRRVVLVHDRTAASSRGHVNERASLIEEIEDGREVPFDVIQIVEPRLTKFNDILLDSTSRDPQTGSTQVDAEKLRSDLLQQSGVSQLQICTD